MEYRPVFPFLPKRACKKSLASEKDLSTFGLRLGKLVNSVIRHRSGGQPMKSLVQFPVLLLAFISPTLLVGCFAPKPSESEIKVLVKAAIEKNGFTSGHSRLLDKDPDLLRWDMEEVSIEKWGSYNEERKYWPVQVRVRGSFYLDPERAFSSRFLARLAFDGEEFDKVGKARLYQNDYGEWIVKVEWKDKD